MKNIQTLHSHTTNSDGELTHLELLEACEGHGVNVIAFTDHDAVLSAEHLEVLRNYRGPTKWISGVELSSGFPKELEGVSSSIFHIVGLFVDPTNNALREHCRISQETRITRMQKIVSNLKSIGIEISEEDCLSASGGEAVARPHIVSAILSKKENVERIEELRLQMREEATTNPETRKKYEELMAQDASRYAYPLFLTDNAYISGVYSADYQYLLDMDAVVKLIRDAGGVAIIAHYNSVSSKLDEALLSKIFAEGRMDGIETIFGLGELNESADSKIAEEIRRTTEIAKRMVTDYGALPSGGVDLHKLHQLQDFVANKEFSFQTDGLVEKIIDSGKINKTWSNL